MPNLRLLTWNTNGLHNHPGRLTVVRAHRPDIALLQETWSLDGPGLVQPAGWQQHLGPEYEVYNSPRRTDNHRGGVCALVHQDVARLVTVYQPQGLDAFKGDALWLRLRLPTRARPLLIGCIYIHSSKDASLWDAIGTMIADALTQGDVLLGGDFNARLPSTRDDRCHGPPPTPFHPEPPPGTLQLCPPRCTQDPTADGNEGTTPFLDICHVYGLVTLNGRCEGDLEGVITYTGAGARVGSSVLDYWLAQPPLLACAQRLLVLCEGEGPDATVGNTSDHRPVRLDLHLEDERAAPVARGAAHMAVPVDRPLGPPAPKFNVDHQAPYVQCLRAQLAGLQLDRMPVSMAANTLIDHMVLAAENVFGAPRPRKDTAKCPTAPWFDGECRKERRRMRQACKKTASREERRVLQRAYQNFLRRKERAYKESFRLRLERACKGSPAEVRHFYRAIDGGATAPCPCPLDAIAEVFEGTFRTEPVGAHDFTFRRPFEDEEDRLQCLRSQQVEELTMPEPPPEPTQWPFTPKMVAAVAMRLKTGRTADSSRLRAELLRAAAHFPDSDKPDALPPRTLEIITAMMNRFYREGFPEDLARAHLVPVHKKGDRADPRNYRPIAIISVLAKLYAALLNHRLSTALEVARARANGQAGFRPGRGTAQQIWTLQALIDSQVRPPPAPGHTVSRKGQFHGGSVRARLKAGAPLYACFVDFSRAFDSVPRERLWRRLRSLKVPEDFVAAIEAYYARVPLCVRGQDGYSGWFDSATGVKQGCPLSPTLFGLYIDYFEEYSTFRLEQEAAARGRSLDPRHRPRVLLYADDVVLLGYSAEELKRLLGHLAAFCDLAGLTVNRSKTQVVIFRAAERLPEGTATQFFFGGHQLEVVDEYRYLGFVFHAWKDPGQHGFPILLKAAEGAAQRLRSRIYALGIRDLLTVCRLFDCYVRPILFYACETWFPYVPALARLNESPIERVHARHLRAALRLPASTATTLLLWETSRTPLFPFLLRQAGRFFQRTAAQVEKGRGHAWDAHHDVFQHHTEDLAAFKDYEQDHGRKPSQGHWLTRLASHFAEYVSDVFVAPQRKSDCLFPAKPPSIRTDLHKKTFARDFFNRVQRQCWVTIHALIRGGEGTVTANYASLIPERPPTSKPALAPILSSATRSYRARDLYLRTRLGVLRLDNTLQRWAGVSADRRTTCPCCQLAEREDEAHFLLRCPKFAHCRTEGPLFPADGPAPSYSQLLNHRDFAALGTFLSAISLARFTRRPAG